MKPLGYDYHGHQILCYTIIELDDDWLSVDRMYIDESLTIELATSEQANIVEQASKHYPGDPNACSCIVAKLKLKNKHLVLCFVSRKVFRQCLDLSGYTYEQQTTTESCMN